MDERVVIEFFSDDMGISSDNVSPMLCNVIHGACKSHNRKLKEGMRWKKRFFFFKARTGRMISRKKSVQVIAREMTNTYWRIILDFDINKYDSSVMPVCVVEHQLETDIHVKYDESTKMWMLRTEL